MGKHQGCNDIAREMLANEIKEDTEDEWTWHTSGKVEGGLAVLAILGLEKEERINVLAKVLKLTNETATSLVNRFYEEDHYDLFDN